MVQHSIAGAKLGMTEAQVEKKLGQPRRILTGTNEFGAWRSLVYRRVTVTLQSGKKVTTLTTKSSEESTKSGVGVGSTRTQLRSDIRGETCEKAYGLDHCWIGTWKAGRVVTDFRLSNGKVSRVTIGFVLD